MITFKQYFLERQYWGTEAAGTVFISIEGRSFSRILFLKRSPDEDSEQGQWEITIGGKKDPEDIDIKATAEREASEELGIVPEDILKSEILSVFISASDDHKGFKYTCFIKIVGKEFEPKLSNEHTDYRWVDINREEIPSPLHFGAEDLFKSQQFLNYIKN